MVYRPDGQTVKEDVWALDGLEALRDSEMLEKVVRSVAMPDALRCMCICAKTVGAGWDQRCEDHITAGPRIHICQRKALGSKTVIQHDR